ncbi:hypothetical protein CRG98_032324, partial [Punica granatum]
LGNLPALDLRVAKWQVVTPSHVRPSRVPGKADTPKPRCLGSAHACPNKIKFGCAHRGMRPAWTPEDHGASRPNLTW